MSDITNIDNLSVDELNRRSFECEFKGNYQDAFKYMEMAVLKGDILSMYYLGEFYEKGQGIEQNYIKAAELYEKVARCNEHLVFCGGPLAPQCDAEFALSMLHEKRLLPNSSNEIAVEWLKKAADDGSASADIEMAKRYLSGYGLEQNNEKALSFLLRATCGCLKKETYPELFSLCLELLKIFPEDPSLFRYIGSCYEEGRGTPVSSKKAIEFYQQAESIEKKKWNELKDSLPFDGENPF